jgi:hypothetical protein
MDCLCKYNGVIQCARKAAKGDMTTIEFAATQLTNQPNMLNWMEEKSLEDTRVLNEYPDIFTKEL